MKIAIISDIHSNLQALEKALETVSKEKVDSVYCLGDIVGYGADPVACVDLVMKYCEASVMGNHDEAVAIGRGFEILPPSGKEAALHNRSKLNETQLAFLTGLPYSFSDHNFTLVHALPEEPERYLRLDSYLVATEQFNHFKTDFCFMGHTHIPSVMSNRMGVTRVRAGNRYLVNVGSVGQPRDNNPRLSMGIFDTESLAYECKRVPYLVESAAYRILEEGLPKSLAERIKIGR
jgi:putative phosphoesterase